MKNYSILFFILFISGISCAQQMDCARFKEGKFMMKADEHGPRIIIVRKGNLQTERTAGTNDKMDFIVKWVDECTYTLAPTAETIIKYKGALSPDALLTVEISEVRKNSYIQVSTSNFSDMVVTSEVFVK